MSISFKRSAGKEIARLQEPIQGQIVLKLEQLAKTPRPMGYRKLKGFAGLFRVKVGDYRIVYQIEGADHVVVLRVRHRRRVYEGL